MPNNIFFFLQKSISLFLLFLGTLITNWWKVWFEYLSNFGVLTYLCFEKFLKYFEAIFFLFKLYWFNLLNLILNIAACISSKRLFKPLIELLNLFFQPKSLKIFNFSKIILLFVITHPPSPIAPKFLVG